MRCLVDAIHVKGGESCEKDMRFQHGVVGSGETTVLVEKYSDWSYEGFYCAIILQTSLQFILLEVYLIAPTLESRA